MPAVVWIGVAAVALALALGVLVVAAPGRPRIPVSRLTSAAPGAPATGLSSVAESTTARVDQLLQRSGGLARLQMALERGGIRQRPAEVVVITGGAAAALGAVGLLAGGLPVALVGALLAPIGARVLVGRAVLRRQAAFAEQLDDALQLMAGSLRVGHSVLRSLDSVSRDTQAPIAEEFSRVVNESRVGRDLGAALDEVVDRTQSEDLAWVVQAIAIQREVGGNLADVLDRVSGTIRERGQLRRQARALSAEGRISGIVLMVLPVLVVGALSVLAPQYIARLTTSTGGLSALALAGVLMLVGGFWIRKTVEVDY